jgi:UPF0176 protein
MAFLHNRVSQKELKRLLFEEKEPRITLSFYRYTPIPDPQQFRDALFEAFATLRVFGRIYVAKEGLNAQVSLPHSNFDAFRTCLYSFSGLDGVRLNIAVEDDGKSFWVLKIKVRDKVVADGIEDPQFDMEKRGMYVDAAAFNKLTEDPSTIVVDMRNHYEFEVGHFENAIEIPSDTFREQLPMAAAMLDGAKDRNIIMYCTGGIRCEKASAFMLHKGFSNVYHLEGGIINYANQVAADSHLENKFKGKNFVFDNRLGERITEDIIAKCHQCGAPADSHTNCTNEACHLLFIQCAQCALVYEGCCGVACRDFIHLPIEEQVALRKGVEKGSNIFNKSKRLRPKLSGS